MQILKIWCTQSRFPHWRAPVHILPYMYYILSRHTLLWDLTFLYINFVFHICASGTCVFAAPHQIKKSIWFFYFLLFFYLPCMSRIRNMNEFNQNICRMIRSLKVSHIPFSFYHHHDMPSSHPYNRHTHKHK